MSKLFLGFAVSSYKDSRNNLAGPVHDLARMSQKVVRDHGFDRIVTRQDSSATATDIPAIVSAAMSQVPDNSLVVGYWSGHGTRYITQADGKLRLRQAIVPYDYDGTQNTLIDGRALRAAFAPPPGKRVHVAIILDSCFSGAALRAVSSAVFTGQGAPKTVPGPRSAVEADSGLVPRTIGVTLALADSRIVTLAACQDDEVAYDTELSGVGPGGAFTFALLAALATGPARDNTWAGLVQEVWRWLKAKGHTQNPNLSGPAWKFNDRAFVLAGAAPVDPPR